jgi:hypothetical protein
MEPLDALGNVMRVATVVFGGFVVVVLAGVGVWQYLRRSYRLRGQ